MVPSPSPQLGGPKPGTGAQILALVCSLLPCTCFNCYTTAAGKPHVAALVSTYLTHFNSAAV